MIWERTIKNEIRHTDKLGDPPPSSLDAGRAPAPGGGLAAEARRLTADLTRPARTVYWADLAATSLATYGALALAVQAGGVLRAAAALAGVLALYRALSFIHELTHLRADEVPGFNAAWNVLIGVPFLAPSFLYEGVHNIHHVQQRYGSAEDPEYLPLARGSGRGLLGFVAVALLAPLGAFLRFALGAPLSLLIRRLRPQVLERLSAMAINPGFRRRDLARRGWAAWRTQELACWLWSWGLVALVASGGVRARAVLTGAAIYAAATFLNQLRTLAAHAWTSDGAPMTLAEQFGDSINVPPPGWLPELWAPVGLRYHALHHLAPRIPYHNLPEAHRRLADALPAGSAYHAVARRGLAHAIGVLAAQTRGR